MILMKSILMKSILKLIVMKPIWIKSILIKLLLINVDIDIDSQKDFYDYYVDQFHEINFDETNNDEIKLSWS